MWRGGPNGHRCHDLAAADIPSWWVAAWSSGLAGRLKFLCALLTMHPHVIGHRSRIALLDRLVQHMKSFGDVWFATHEEVARWCKAKGGT